MLQQIINQPNIQLTEQEHQILQLGPQFIFDDPKTATRRRTNELAILKRKLKIVLREEESSQVDHSKNLLLN